MSAWTDFWKSMFGPEEDEEEEAKDPIAKTDHPTEDGKKLKHCPLCGGRAMIEERHLGRAINDATIVCQTCGLRLEWSQQFVIARNLDGKETVVATTISPEDAWNRRTSDDQ